MSLYAWIEALKPGDEVIVSVGTWGDDFVGRVGRLTPTQIIVAGVPGERGSLRFRRRDGHAVGDAGAWGRGSWISEPTPERVAEVREGAHRRRLLAKIRQTSWKEQTTATLETVVNAIIT